MRCFSDRQKIKSGGQEVRGRGFCALVQSMSLFFSPLTPNHSIKLSNSGTAAPGDGCPPLGSQIEHPNSLEVNCNLVKDGKRSDDLNSRNKCLVYL